jgi:hypothetical protein
MLNSNWTAAAWKTISSLTYKVGSFNEESTDVNRDFARSLYCPMVKRSLAKHSTLHGD